MKRRVLRWCLLAYPRGLRERDGAELHELAEELAVDHGTVREALGLVRGGWTERRRSAGHRRRVAIALTAATGSVLAVLTWSAAAEPAQVEEDRFGCAGDCAAVEREVAHRVDQGWTCTRSDVAATISWRCALD